MGVLPFLSEAILVDDAGNAVPGIPAIKCSIWPAQGSRNSAAGRHHTHRGEAAVTHSSELLEPNRALLLDGERYRIVGASVHPFVPHVALELLATHGRS